MDIQTEKTKEQAKQEAFRNITEPKKTNRQSLFAMFVNRGEAEAARNSLKKNDFADEDIALLMPNTSGKRDFVYNQSTSIKFGASIGAVFGFFLLGFVGLYMGWSHPEEMGMSSWIVSVVVASFIGLVFGTAIGALVGIGTPRTAGKRYGFYLNEGGIILRVHVDNKDESHLALSLMEKHRGQDISILPDSEVWSKILPEKRKLAFY